MAFRIEIALKRGVRDPRARGVVAKARKFLRLPVGACQTRDVYKVDVPLSPKELRKVKNAFTDPVIARSAIGRLPAPSFDWLIEVGFKPGVTDNVGRTAREVVRDVLDRELTHEEDVYTSVQYFLPGTNLSAERRRAHRPRPARQRADPDRSAFSRPRSGPRRRSTKPFPRSAKRPMFTCRRTTSAARTRT